MRSRISSSVESFVTESEDIIVTLGLEDIVSSTTIAEIPFPSRSFTSRSAHSISNLIDGSSDTRSQFSYETFATAQEPPTELLVAIGRQGITNPLSKSNETFLSCNTSHQPSPSAQLACHQIAEDQQIYQQQPVPHCNKELQSWPSMNMAVASNCNDVRITRGHFNLIQNTYENVNDIRIGLQTLAMQSAPAAFHMSQKRQKEVNQQIANMKALKAWGSQLLIGSLDTSALSLSVPLIQRHDLEEAVKDIFIWLYTRSSSTQHHTMWLYEE